MIQRAFFSAFAAILLSAMLIQTAAAYPSTAKSAATTVTGTYRPLDLDLTLLDGTGALTFTLSTVSSLSFQVDFNGTFTSSYGASGQAGTWTLFLGTGLGPTLPFGDTTVSQVGNILTLIASGANAQVGTLTYMEGFTVESGSLPVDGSDTPLDGDVFKLFAPVGGSVLQVVCDEIGQCNNFDLTLLQDLQHIGPYTGELQTLSGTKLNASCGAAADPVPCGSFTGLTASSVPEPATLALLGLGLAGLGLSRRARA